MHGQDRFRPRSDALGHVGRVEVERPRIDVGEHGSRPPARDRLGSRIERERGADHLVPGPDPQCVEHEHKRVRAVGHSDRMRGFEETGRLLLEGAHFGAEDELPALEDAVHRRPNVGEERSVLRLDVGERDGHGGPV